MMRVLDDAAGAARRAAQAWRRAKDWTVEAAESAHVDFYRMILSRR